MKVLLYGARGWIGGQFLDLLDKNNIECIKGNSRVDNDITLAKEIEETKPTHVVSFIGRTHGKIGEKVYTTIDYLEQDGKLLDNVRDNLYGPLLLSELCKQNKIHFTYLGTGCIFKFDDEHPFGKEENGFDENALPNFFGSSYSTVKGFTDRLMAFYDDYVLNLRIRMPITGEQNSRNFITKITTYEKICSIPNSMSVLPELLPMVLTMMKNKQTGTINLTNPGLISHNEILDMFKEIVDPNFTYKNFSQEEQRKILAADRSNNYLDTRKLETLFPQVRNIKESVRDMLVQYKDTYSPSKKIDCLFITGGCGFIGSNFINYYCEKNPDVKVINFDALYYCADVNNINKEIRDSENYTFIEGNLQSYDLIKHVFETNKISHVIHFAAQSHVQTSFTDSIRYTQDNILGTHNLLEVNRLYNKSLKRFIHVSTDEVYGESMNKVDETHKTEHSILCPTNPYAATKAGAELIAQSYCHSFKMPIIITRGNNVYGPNQYPEKLIPKFIKQLKNNEKVTIQGDGSTVRAFLHAYDTARAFECILENGKKGEIYNIGCDEGMEYSVMEVAKMLIRMIKDTDDYDNWITYIEDRPYNDERYYISNQKLRDLGWDIKIKFENGLQELVGGMNSCLVVQCFCKTIETLELLKSLHNCSEIKDYNLLLYVDNANNKQKFQKKNSELISLLKKYKLENESRFKSIKLIISETNNGPYVSCYNAINYAFTYNDYVIYSEDDIIFCKDTIKYFNLYRDTKEFHNEKCIGITSFSIFCYAKTNIYKSKQYKIEIQPEKIDKKNSVKNLINENKLQNKIYKTYWGADKQMGLFKNGWDKIKLYRSIEFIESGKSGKYSSDTFTAMKIKELSLYFLFSAIPRCNDIGLFNELGWTALHYNKEPSLFTIKYLTSEDIDNTYDNLEIINDVSILYKTILE